MATQEQLLKSILDELVRLREDVGIIQGDLNAIRNGDYDPPAGVDRSMPHQKQSDEPEDPRTFATSRQW